MATYRIDYAFKNGALLLSGLADSGHAAPPSDDIPPGGSGFWLTVHDRTGRQTHAQILRDPRGVGALAGAGAVGPVLDQTGSVFVPDPQSNGHVSFHMGFPAQADAAFTGERVATFALKGGGWGILNAFDKLRRVLMGPKPTSWLLILGDGFPATDADSDIFNKFAADVVASLCAMPPFKDTPQLRKHIVIDIGPRKPGGAFGWTRQDLGKERWLLTLEGARVTQYVKQTLRLDPLNVLVVLNLPLYGGSGGDPAVAALGKPGAWGRGQAIGAAIHELCHSAFALADEYADKGSPGGQGPPIELNVAKDETDARAKWGELFDPKIQPHPTDQTTVRTVGMFAGAKYDAAQWRSQATCRMFVPEGPFCAACRQVISSVLASELPPAAP